MTTNTAGLGAAVAAVCCTAVYQIWAGSKQKELGAGSMQLMHQFQPHATGLLVLLVLGVEPLGLPGTPSALGQGTILGYQYTPLAVAAILTTAVLGLLVSLSTFLVIAATSSVTFNVVRPFVATAAPCACLHEELGSGAPFCAAARRWRPDVCVPVRPIL